MRSPTFLSITSSSMLAVMLGVAGRPAFAQVPIVATHTLTPTAEDLGEMPQYAHVQFGAAVAIDGERIAVGMPAHNSNVGRVGIYERTAEGWRRIATLSPSNPDDFSFGAFGSEVDFDGDTVAIAARGAAYVFREQDGAWRQIGRVAVDNGDRTLETHVAYDNGILALSRIGYDEDGIDLPGEVYLYRHGAKHGLHQIAKLRASDGFPGDRFGASLAMERRVLVVGAAPKIGAPSAAYVFSRHGHDWAERQKLSGSTAGMGPSGESSEFGAAVAIHKRAILVGAPLADVPGGDDSTSPEGNGYVFLPYRACWFESQALNADGQFYLQFGENVAMGRGMVAATTPILEPIMSAARSSVLVFDWVGQELRYGREAWTTEIGWRAKDLDFSGRTLVVGMNEYSFASPNGNIVGSVIIVEYAKD